MRISTEYLPNIPDGESRYLNIERYEDPETGTHKGGCVDEERTYRILETAVFTWTTNPNPPGKLSIAKISKVGDNLEVKGSASEDFRTNAGIMTESLVIFQDDEEGHNHTGGDKGRKIPIEGLEDDVKTPSVTSSGHLEGTLPDFTLRDLVVNTAQLVDKAVTSNKLADGSVATDQLVDLAVTSNKLSDGAVDTTKLADGAVDTAKLANGAVDTDKLANAAVQPANLNLVQGATSSTKTANTTGVAVPLSAYTQTSIVNVYPMSEGEVSWSIKRSATGWEVVVKATGDTTTHPTVDFTVTHFISADPFDVVPESIREPTMATLSRSSVAARTSERKAATVSRSRSANHLSSKAPTVQPDVHSIPALLQLQRTLGNQGVVALLQRKLNVSQPSDASEKEADRVADRVMRSSSSAPSVDRQGDNDEVATIGRSEETMDRSSEDEVDRASRDDEPDPMGIARMGDEEAVSLMENEEIFPMEDEEAVSRMENEEIARMGEEEDVSLLENEEVSLRAKGDRTSGGAAPKRVQGQLDNPGTGSPLPNRVRSQIEPVVDTNLSDVRVHAGGDAQQAARDLSARAFTHGSNIWLGKGESADDTRLMAHEATHVVQQGGGIRRKVASLSRSAAWSVGSPFGLGQRSRNTSGRVYRNTEENVAAKEREEVATRAAPPLLQSRGNEKNDAPVSRVAQPVIQRSWLGDAWSSVKGAVSGAVDLVAEGLEAGINWIKDKARDFISRIPGYKLFTVVIAHDPITGAAVARNGRNFIEAGLDIIPNGASFKAKLEQEGALGEAASWLDEQIALLTIKPSQIIANVVNFWNSLELSDIASPSSVLSRLASIFADPVQRVVQFARNVVGKFLEIIKKYVLSKLVVFIRDRTTAYPLLTLILGKDPITGDPVERNGMNLLRGFMSLTEDGQEKLRQMEETGSLQKSADWIDKTVAKLDLTPQAIMEMFTEAWSLVTLENLLKPVETFQRLLGIFLPPIGRILTFLVEVGLKILQMIKDALIARLIAFARQVPGYILLTVIIGKDPFSGQAVERSVENIVHGFLDLIPGGEETFQNLKQTGAIQRAADRIDAAVASLNFTFAYFVGLFKTFWNSLSLSDLAAPLEVFGRVVALFGDPIAKLFNFVVQVLRLIIEVVLEIMRFPVKLIQNIITKSIQAISDIRRDPIGFLKNLLRAVKEGFALFFGNIGKHLLAGLTGWLFGQMKDAGITPPPDLSLRSILGLVMQILGITTQKIFAIVERKIGKEKMDRIRAVAEKISGAWSFVTDIVKGGPGALWEKIKSKITGLWDSVLQSVRNWVITKIIEKVTVKLLSMLDPTGIMAVVNSFIAFFKAVQSFIEYLRQMLEIVNSFVEGVAEIAKGSVTRAATFLEGALARALPVAIGFLANQVGLGGIGKKVGEMIKKVQAKVEAALEWLVDKAIKAGAAVFSLGKRGVEAVKGGIEKLKEWWKTKKEFTDKGGESHTLFFEGKTGTLMIRSNETEVDRYLDEQAKDADDETSKTVSSARTILSKLKVITRKDVKTVKDREEITDAIGQLSTLLMKLGGVGIRNRPQKANWDFPAVGRATVDKLSTASSRGGSDASANSNWWQFLRNSGLSSKLDKWVRMHLISARVGGSGAEPKNLIPAPNSVNRGPLVDSFENAAKDLVEPGVAKPNVIWLDVQAKSPHPKDDSVAGYDEPWFFSKVAMRGGLHFFNEQKDWAKDSKIRFSEDVSIPPPDFGDILSLSQPSGTELKRLDPVFTTTVSGHIKQEIKIDNPRAFDDLDDFKQRMQARLNPKVWSDQWLGKVIPKIEFYVSRGRLKYK